MSCWKNENDLEKRINKFMEYSIKFNFIPATEEDLGNINGKNTN